jgi:hypothetical protein
MQEAFVAERTARSFGKRAATRRGRHSGPEWSCKASGSTCLLSAPAVLTGCGYNMHSRQLEMGEFAGLIGCCAGGAPSPSHPVAPRPGYLRRALPLHPGFSSLNENSLPRHPAASFPFHASICRVLLPRRSLPETTPGETTGEAEIEICDFALVLPLASSGRITKRKTRGLSPPERSNRTHIPEGEAGETVSRVCESRHVRHDRPLTAFRQLDLGNCTAPLRNWPLFRVRNFVHRRRPELLLQTAHARRGKPLLPPIRPLQTTHRASIASGLRNASRPAWAFFPHRSHPRRRPSPPRLPAMMDHLPKFRRKPKNPTVMTTAIADGKQRSTTPTVIQTEAASVAPVAVAPTATATTANTNMTAAAMAGEKAAEKPAQKPQKRSAFRGLHLKKRARSPPPAVLPLSPSPAVVTHEGIVEHAAHGVVSRPGTREDREGRAALDGERPALPRPSKIPFFLTLSALGKSSSPNMPETARLG